MMLFQELWVGGMGLGFNVHRATVSQTARVLEADGSDEGTTGERT
jgi:hypothetical protein